MNNLSTSNKTFTVIRYKKNGTELLKDTIEIVGCLEASEKDNNYQNVAYITDTNNGFLIYLKSRKYYLDTMQYDINNIITLPYGKSFAEYRKVLNCAHHLAKAINFSYMNGDKCFDLKDWMHKNRYMEYLTNN